MFTYREDPTGFHTVSQALSAGLSGIQSHISAFFFLARKAGRVGGERGDIQEGGGKFLGHFIRNFSLQIIIIRIIHTGSYEVN